MARSNPAGAPNRTPVPVQIRRSFGDIAKAVLAFFALALLVVGVPLSLAYFIGWPLPSEMPGLDTLSQEISTGVFLKILGVLVWIAWAQFTACVLVEVKAAVSGVGMPSRVPGAGPQQLLARQLVGALLLLGTAAASFTPGVSAIGNAFESSGQPQVVAEAEQFHSDPATAGGGAAAEAEPAMAVPQEETARETTEAGDPTKYYRIQPPDGRHHDTLWGISERHLGDGMRYKEIFELNKDRVQPDGSKLSESSLIRPGWIMEMPADAEGGDLVEAPYELEELSDDEVEEYQEYQQTGDTDWPDLEPRPGPAPAGGDTGPDGAGPEDTDPDSTDDRLADPFDPGAAENALLPGLAAQLPHLAERAFDRADLAETAPESGEAASDSTAADSGFGLSDALMAAPLLAAGLLAALGRSRRQALWQAAAGVFHRSVSDDLEPRDSDGAAARDALLAGADPAAVAFLDQALRRLSADLDTEGRVLPPVYAAWLSDTDLNLQLALPSGTPPAPWQLGQSENYWRLERADLPAGADREPADAEAPYPGLVSLGTRDGTRLLVNLEAVPGMVSILGDRVDRDAVLASVAAELATSGWSDRMTVTLVGFAPELTALAPTRVRYLEDIGGLLEVMETETTLRHSNLQHTGQDSILTGRTGPARGHQWAPHLVIIGVEPTEEQAERLGGLATVSAALGIGYVVTSDEADLPGLAWEFEISEDGTLSEPAMGLEVTAQQLPARQRAAVARLFAELESDSGEQRPAAPQDPAFLVDLSARGEPEVYAELLGGYTVRGLSEPDPERAGQLREALAMLLLHRTGLHPRVLATALWPRGVSDDVRDTFISRLADWLGTQSADGQPRLTVRDDGRLALSQRVTSDWDVLRTLHHQNITDAERGRSTAERIRGLTDALSLARGPLLAGERDGGRFDWLRHEIVDAQYPLLVAEIALTLAREQRTAGQGEAAYLAVRSALGAAPADERLWNELLRAAHATGNNEWLTGAISWLAGHHQQLFGSDQPLPAETEALLDELHPAWRGLLPVS